jgi:threonine dehydrogenase-like Zn-dependent dehydrogenase
LDLVCTYGSIRETVIVNAVQNHRLRIVKDLALLKNVLCYDPAQFALAAVRDAKLGPGDRVAVIGLGAIGLIALQYAKKLGANFVIGIDPIGRRRDLAKKYGATLCLDPSKIDAGLEIKKATDKEGVDIIIETSGSVHALQASLKGLAYSGTLAYVAFAKPFPQGLWLGQEAHYNYAKIIFSRAASEPTPGFPRWSRKRIEDVVFEHLTNGYLDCEDIIYPVVSFDDSAAAYMRYVDTNPEEGIKLGIEFKE